MNTPTRMVNTRSNHGVFRCGSCQAVNVESPLSEGVGVASAAMPWPARLFLVSRAHIYNHDSYANPTGDLDTPRRR